MNIGDRVKVIDQDITGTIVEHWGNKIVIEEDDCEYDDNRLEFRVSDVQPLKMFKVFASYVTYLRTEIEATDEGHAEKIVDDLDGGIFKQESDYNWSIDSIVDTGEISHA
jgi:hypothetical protein